MTDSSLKLCRDGIMRVSQLQKDPNTNKFYEYNFDSCVLDDFVPNIFLKCINKPFHMEEGLTVKELFRNLKPYSNVLEGLASMDFEAFAKEAETPPKDLKNLNQFKHVRVQGTGTFNVVPKYKEKPRKNVGPSDERGLYTKEDVEEIFGIGKAQITDEYEFMINFDNCLVPHQPEYDENTNSYIYEYGTSLTPLYEYAHLPLVVKNKIKIFDESTFSVNKSHLSHSQPLFNPNNPLVNKDGSVLSIEIPYQPSFKEAIIDGCLWEWGFNYSPAQREETCEKIEQRFEEIDNTEAEPRDVEEEIKNEQKEEMDFLEEIYSRDKNATKEVSG